MSIDDLTPEERALAERGGALVAAAVARERAPLALRERVEAERSRAAAAPRRGLARVLGPAAAGLAAVIVAVVVIAGGGTGAPTVNAVAGLSLKGSAQPAPAQQPDNPKLLQAAIDGLDFPYWGGTFMWEASGERRDTIKGRDALTVFYTGRSGAEIGYSIVSGPTLDVPDGRRTVIKGVTYTAADDGPRQILTWQRQGHTCVISAPDAVPTAKLIELASWTGKGAVAF